MTFAKHPFTFYMVAAVMYLTPACVLADTTDNLMTRSTLTGDWGGIALADELLKLIELHDASNIAAVFVEPMAGSAGVPVTPLTLRRSRPPMTACVPSVT